MTDDCGHIKNDGEPCTYEAKYPDGKCGHHTASDEVGDGGRPTKLTRERQEQIAAAIESGKSITSAARMAGVSRNAVYDWMEKGETQEEGVYAEFHDRLMRARGHGEDFYYNLALELAKENEDHRFIASLMKQRYPDSWGDTETGVEADTVEINVSEDIAETWPTQ
jgi:transposase-like protein